MHRVAEADVDEHSCGTAESPRAQWSKGGGSGQTLLGGASDRLEHLLNILNSQKQNKTLRRMWQGLRSSESFDYV